MPYNIPSVDKFDIALSDATNKYVLPKLTSRKQEAKKAYTNLLLNLDGPQKLENASTNEGRFLALINTGAGEIFDSYESILDSEIYIRRFPFKKTRISKTRYLTHVFQNYLDNIYILQVRIKNYIRLIEKIYATGSRRKSIKKKTQALFILNSKLFKEIVDVRGTHVHKQRYSDHQLKRLQFIELLISRVDKDSSLHQELDDYFENAFQTIRKDKINIVKNWNLVAKITLERVFLDFYPIVFNTNGDLAFPFVHKNI